MKICLDCYNLYKNKEKRCPYCKSKNFRSYCIYCNKSYEGWYCPFCGRGQDGKKRKIENETKETGCCGNCFLYAFISLIVVLVIADVIRFFI